MAWYNPGDWFDIGNTGYDPWRERGMSYRGDYANVTDPFARDLRMRMQGQGQLGAEQQAMAGAEQQRRQAKALAYSAPGVPVAQATRAAERAGDYGEQQAQAGLQQARVADQYLSEQAYGQLLEQQARARQQRAAIDALYAQMGQRAAVGDFATEQAEIGGTLGFFGNLLGSFF